MQLKDILAAKYPNGATLKEIMSDGNLKDLIDPTMLPEFLDVENPSCRFMNFMRRVTVNGVLYRAYYLYIRKNGSLANYAEQEYVQIPASMHGFILRFLIPVEAPIEFNIILDYFVDMDRVNYNIETETRRNPETGAAEIADHFQFGIIDLGDYPDVSFDPMIAEFNEKRGELCEYLGIEL